MSATNPPDVAKAWLSCREVAELLDVPESTLRSWLARGKGPAHYRLGVRTIRFRPADVTAYAESRRVTQ